MHVVYYVYLEHAYSGYIYAVVVIVFKYWVKTTLILWAHAYFISDLT